MHRYAWLIWLLLLCVVSGCPVTQSQDTPVDYQYLKDQVTDSGYYLYASLQDVEDNNEAIRLSSLITASYGNASCYNCLGLDKIKQIANILDIK